MRSLNFGLIFIFKSSIKPKIKNNVQNDIYSMKKIFFEKNRYKKTTINKKKIVIYFVKPKRLEQSTNNAN